MKRWLSPGFITGSLMVLLLCDRSALALGTNAVPVPNNVLVGSLEDPYEPITADLGSWIWAAQVYDRQTVLFWRTIDIPETNVVQKARLKMTADNEFTLYLDGRELGQGVEWRELFNFNLTPLMSPGRHVLAVEAFNASRAAGLLLGMRVTLADGQSIAIKSDAGWKIVPAEVRGWKKMTEPMADWPPATVEAPVGADPWSAFPQNVNFMPTLQPIDTYFWQAGWFQIAILSVCGLVILISLRLTAQLSLQRKEQLLLQQERARIARDIHDDVGSRMTQLVLNGEVMQSELSSDSSLRPQLDRICQEAREVLSTMDEILWAVNPRRDTLRDFSSYVCSYAENFLKSTPIQCLFEVDTEMSFAALDLPRRRSLLMAIKETLNNVAKHSGATELKLQIQCQNGILVVVVQDNGRGFDPANARSGRNGLGNLNLRIGELGGNCVITSQPGQGCRVEFVIPLETPRPFRWHWPWEEKNEVKPPGGKNLRLNEAAESYDPTKC